MKNDVEEDMLDCIILQDSVIENCFTSYLDTLPDHHHLFHNDVQSIPGKPDTITQVEEKIGIEQPILQHAPVKVEFGEAFLGVLGHKPNINEVVVK